MPASLRGQRFWSFNSLFLVSLKTKHWLQQEVTKTLDSTVVRTQGQENLASVSEERLGLTCTVQAGALPQKRGANPHGPSHPANSASSSCLKVGGWMCGPGLRNCGESESSSGNASAKLRTGGSWRGPWRRVSWRVVLKCKVRPFFPTWIMADLFRHSSKGTEVSSASLTSDKLLCFVLFFLLNPCWSLITITTAHFFLISSCKTASLKIARKWKGW